MSINMVILKGKLGKKPTIHSARDGRKFTFVNFACTETYKDKTGQTKEIVNWFSSSVWGKTAEYVVKNADKGDSITIEGTLSCKKEKSSPTDQYGKDVISINTRRIEIDKKAGKTWQANDSDFPIDNTVSFTSDEIPF